MEEDKSFEETKLVVNLDGASEKEDFVKVLIKEGEKTAKFVKFELKMTKKFENPNEKEPKVIANLEVEGEEFEGQPALVPLFIKPVVTKAAEGSKNSNSKLFDILTKLELLQPFKDSNDVAGGFSYKQLTTWLENTLTNKIVRVLVENTKSDKPYSVVKKVYGLKGDSKSESKIVTPKDSGVVSEEKSVPEVE